jgi:hypothetical protein
MINALAPAGKALDCGLYMNLKTKTQTVRTFVCSFQFLHTSDLPQQNESAGTMRQNAILGCRSCLITKDDRNDLVYDIVNNGRYQFEMEHVIELNLIIYPKLNGRQF